MNDSVEGTTDLYAVKLESNDKGEDNEMVMSGNLGARLGESLVQLGSDECEDDEAYYRIIHRITALGKEGSACERVCKALRNEADIMRKIHIYEHQEGESKDHLLYWDPPIDGAEGACRVRAEGAPYEDPELLSSSSETKSDKERKSESKSDIGDASSRKSLFDRMEGLSIPETYHRQGPVFEILHDVLDGATGAIFATARLIDNIVFFGGATVTTVVTSLAVGKFDFDPDEDDVKWQIDLKKERRKQFLQGLEVLMKSLIQMYPTPVPTDGQDRQAGHESTKQCRNCRCDRPCGTSKLCAHDLVAATPTATWGTDDEKTGANDRHLLFAALVIVDMSVIEKFCEDVRLLHPPCTQPLHTPCMTRGLSIIRCSVPHAWFKICAQSSAPLVRLATPS